MRFRGRFVQHGDLVTKQFEVYTTTTWHNNLLYLSGHYNDESVKGVNLYTFDFSTNELTALLSENVWRDFNPYPSPNGQKVAFFSDRSGRMYLWVYDFETERYTQITDDGSYLIDDRSSRIIWEDEQTILTSVYQEDKYRMARLILE